MLEKLWESLTPSPLRGLYVREPAENVFPSRAPARLYSSILFGIHLQAHISILSMYFLHYC
jgi:hypothetical protein